MDKLKLLWLAPKVEFKGKGICDAWAEQMERAGWEIVNEPPCDLVFYGSDSMLEGNEHLIGQYPTIAYFWGYDPERLLNNDFRKWAQGRINTLAHCTRILVPGPITMYQLADWGIPSQICVPGIDAGNLAMPSPPPERRSQIMFLSRLAPHKGLEILIQAVAMLEPQPKLLVCGPGDATGYQDLADRLHVNAEFREIEDREKALELASSMVLVHPSTYEGFGMPPLEALAVGTPALVLETPQLLWLLKEHGIYFANAVDLAGTLANVLSQPEPIFRMAAVSQKWVHDTMTLEKACDRLWPHIHQTIKEYWGRRVKADPGNQELVREAYEAEHRRNYAYGQQDVAGYNGPARFDPTWSRHFRAAFFIRELKTAGAQRVLDVGCGPVYPTIFAKAGFEVTGFDVSIECLSQVTGIAAKWGVADKVHTHQGYAEALPFPDGIWDAVVLGEILEHVADPAKVVSEALRVLSPGGVLVASTPIGGHHYDPFHAGPDQGGWDELTLKRLLAPWASQVSKLEQIAEDGQDPSCYLIVMTKPT